MSLDGAEPVSREYARPPNVSHMSANLSCRYIYELEKRVQNLQQEIPNTASSLHGSSKSQTPVYAEDPVSTHGEPSEDHTAAGDPPRNVVNLSPNFTEGAGIR